MKNQIISKNLMLSKRKNIGLKFFLLFVVVILIITTMVLIIANNQWNSAINTNNSNNWNPNQDKNWEDYYKNNCPSNKKSNLIDYKDKLNNISLISTDKKLKNFYLSDLLKKDW